MKKFVVLCLAGLLVLAFGVTGYAQELKLEFRASGSIDVQSHLSENVPPLNPGATSIVNSLSANNNSLGVNGPQVGSNDYNTFKADGRPDRALNRHVSYWDSRMSPRFEFAMGKELNAVLQFEIDAGRFGSNQTHNAPGIGTRETEGVGWWSTDRAAVEVKYMYFDVGLPYFGLPFPMSLRAGAQPLAVRPAFLNAVDGSGVTGAIKIDPVTINPMWFKLANGQNLGGNWSNDWTNTSNNAYGLQLNGKVQTFTLGGYGFYYRMDAYPSWATSNTFAAAAVAPSGFNQFLAGTQQANFWWLGIYADGKAGPVDINFDAGYDWGNVHDKLTPTMPDVKYSGWAARLKVDFPWEKFNFGVTGMYASGSDLNKTSAMGLAGQTPAGGLNQGLSTRVNSWMVPPGSEIGATNSESAVFYGMEAGASGGQGFAVTHQYYQASKGAFGGTWFAKLYGSAKVTPWYKVTVQGLYIGDTTSNGNTFGTALRFPGTNSTLLRNDNYIGFELDMINEFQIYKNLTFKVFGGYLWAGPAMDLYTGIPSVGNFSMHNPWAFRTRLLYTF